MEKITSAKELKLAIVALEAEKVQQQVVLKSEISIAIESLKPSNLMNTLGKKIKENLMDSLIGLLAGYVSKKVLVGSGNPAKNAFGNIVQMLVAGLVSNNTSEIKEKGLEILKTFFSSKEEHD